jgi:hypothetical protein
VTLTKAVIMMLQAFTVFAVPSIGMSCREITGLSHSNRPHGMRQLYLMCHMRTENGAADGAMSIASPYITDVETPGHGGYFAWVEVVK